MLPFDEFSDATVAEWTGDHAQNLRTMLASETFQLALAHLGQIAPSLLDGADVNKTLVASGEVKGFNAAISFLFSLTRQQPKATPTSAQYPDPDDDAAWDEKDSTRPV